ncbi:MAG: ATP-binding protein [Terriglobales bacterium]
MSTITEKNDEMSALAHRLATEYAASRILAEGGDAAESLGRVLAVMGRELEWDYCVCWRLQTATETMRLLSSWMRDGERIQALDGAVRDFELHPGTGLAGRVWQSGRAEWVEDAGSDGGFLLAAGARAAKLGAAVCFPIAFRGQVIGLLQFLAGRGAAPHAASMAVLTSLAEQIGRFLDHTSVEAALRASEAHFRSLFEANLAGMHCSLLDGTPLRVNPAFVQMFGFGSTQEAMACYSGDLYVDLADREALLQQLRLRGRDVNRQMRLRHRDGHVFWVLANTVLVPGVDGAPDSNESALLDITESKQREERQQQSTKLEGMGRLAGGLAHDFNNLLTIIDGYADLALSRLEEGHSARAAIEKVRGAGQQAAGLTQQLLAFGQRQSSDLSWVDAEAQVRASLEMLAPALGAAVKVHVETEPGLGRIRADAGQLSQIIMNLALNARDAMPQGGDLLVEMQNVEIGPAYTRQHVQAREGGYLCVAVSDNGEGMSEETRKRAFEPLFTTKPRGKGTGLGLATVYGLVLQHNGWIELYSESGHGTTFKLYFPQAQEEAEPQERAHRLEPGHGESLLVVEDKPEQRALIEDVLTGQGYRVLGCGSCQEALARSAPIAGPDLLITDLVLRDGSGPELAQQMTGTPVLFLSGFSRAAAILQGLLPAGCDGVGFLQKPLAPATLVEAVAAALRARQAAGAKT